MSTLRERFESIMYVSIQPQRMSFSESMGKYVCTDDCFKTEVAFVNGAWLMFQELSKDEN